MASESNKTDVMLDGKTGYMKKTGSMKNLGIIHITDASVQHKYSEVYIAPGSSIDGTDLTKTNEYKDCEDEMRMYLEDDFDSTTEGYTVENNAKNMLAKLKPSATNIATITGRIVLPSYSYKITNVSTPYKFVLNKDGYYESNNQNVNSSYAKCRITFSMDIAKTITLNCINSGESSYDFGIISNIDSTLSNNADVDSSVFKSFKGQSSTNAVQVDIDIPAGEHFIEIKYRKDGSSSEGNDSFQFKIKNTDVVNKM